MTVLSLRKHKKDGMPLAYVAPLNMLFAILTGATCVAFVDKYFYHYFVHILCSTPKSLIQGVLLGIRMNDSRVIATYLPTILELLSAYATPLLFTALALLGREKVHGRKIKILGLCSITVFAVASIPVLRNTYGHHGFAETLIWLLLCLLPTGIALCLIPRSSSMQGNVVGQGLAYSKSMDINERESFEMDTTNNKVFCRHCGNQINEMAVICPHCGCETGRKMSSSVSEDVPSAGLNVLSFLIPFVGLILYLTMRETTPKRANAIGKWALISVGISVGLYFILLLLSI